MSLIGDFTQCYCIDGLFNTEYPFYDKHGIIVSEIQNIEKAFDPKVIAVWVRITSDKESNIALRTIMHINHTLTTITTPPFIREKTMTNILEYSKGGTLCMLDLNNTGMSSMSFEIVRKFINTKSNPFLYFGISSSNQKLKSIASDKCMSKQFTKLKIDSWKIDKSLAQSLKLFKNIQWIIIKYATFNFDDFRNFDLSIITTYENNESHSKETIKHIGKMTNLKHIHLKISLQDFKGCDLINACSASTISIYNIDSVENKNDFTIENKTCKTLCLCNMPLWTISNNNCIETLKLRHHQFAFEKETDKCFKKLKNLHIKGNGIHGELRNKILTHVNSDCNIEIEWELGLTYDDCKNDMKFLLWKHKGHKLLIARYKMQGIYERMYLQLKKIIEKQHKSWNEIIFERKQNMKNGKRTTFNIISNDSFNYIGDLVYSSLIETLLLKKEKGKEWLSFKEASEMSRFFLMNKNDS